MARLTRRDLLRAACGGYALLAGGLLAACGNGQLRPTNTAGRPVGAAPLAASPTAPVTPIITVYPPIPTIDVTVLLPTAVRPPNHQTVTLKPPIPNVPTWTPAPTERPEDPFCYTTRPARDANPFFGTHISTFVVIATVSAILPARWSTPDGQRPANPHDPNSRARIYTPLWIQVEQALKGTPASTLLVFTQVGRIGQDCSVISDGVYDFSTVGERVFLFLQAPYPDHPKQLDGTPLWLVVERYTITGGQATNVYQDIPLAELTAIVTSTVANPQVIPTYSAPMPRGATPTR